MNPDDDKDRKPGKKRLNPFERQAKILGITVHKMTLGFDIGEKPCGCHPELYVEVAQ